MRAIKILNLQDIWAFVMLSFAAPLCVSFKKGFWSESYDLLCPFPNISLFLKITQSFFFIHRIVWMSSPWSCRRAVGTAHKNSDLGRHRAVLNSWAHLLIFLNWNQIPSLACAMLCNTWVEPGKVFLCFMLHMAPVWPGNISSVQTLWTSSYLKRTTTLGTYQYDGP